jgi:hypothetical protein
MFETAMLSWRSSRPRSFALPGSILLHRRGDRAPPGRVPTGAPRRMGAPDDASRSGSTRLPAGALRHPLGSRSGRAPRRGEGVRVPARVVPPVLRSRRFSPRRRFQSAPVRASRRKGRRSVEAATTVPFGDPFRGSRRASPGKRAGETYRAGSRTSRTPPTKRPTWPEGRPRAPVPPARESSRDYTEVAQQGPPPYRRRRDSRGDHRAPRERFEVSGSSSLCSRLLDESALAAVAVAGATRPATLKTAGPFRVLLSVTGGPNRLR